ncbi:MAG: hypothetical protein RR661_04220, partial [Anaerovoracaceae bacterium]
KCKLLDPKGKEVPSKVVFNEDNKKVMLVLADTSNKDVQVEGKTKYTLTIDQGFVAASGETLDKEKGETVTFETLDPKSSMTVSMVMMGVMLVGMIFFTSREAKKQVAETAKKKDEKVNPYKVAKETGKSVEEIVEKEKKKKEKQAAAAAKKERHKRENKVEIASDNFKVKGPRPISAAGIEFKPVKAAKPEKKAQSTNPKNQSGKQKNKKK